jgi:hypothetical protein
VSRFAHHQIAHTSESGQFHYVETEACRQAIELGSYRNTTNQRLDKSEQKYSVDRRTSRIRKLPFPVRGYGENLCRRMAAPEMVAAFGDGLRIMAYLKG